MCGIVFSFLGRPNKQFKIVSTLGPPNRNRPLTVKESNLSFGDNPLLIAPNLSCPYMSPTISFIANSMGSEEYPAAVIVNYQEPNIVDRFGFDISFGLVVSFVTTYVFLRWGNKWLSERQKSFKLFVQGDTINRIVVQFNKSVLTKDQAIAMLLIVHNLSLNEALDLLTPSPSPPPPPPPQLMKISRYLLNFFNTCSSAHFFRLNLLPTAGVANRF